MGIGGPSVLKLALEPYRDAAAGYQPSLTARISADSINLHPGEEIFSTPTSQRQAGGSR
jgi:hypothetical protein